MFPLLTRIPVRLCLCRASCVRFSTEAPLAAPPAAPLYMKEYHEPKYLDLLKPSIPFYDLVNIRVRGFDYPVVESFAKFIQKTCSDLKLKTCGFWGVPAVHLRLDTYQRHSDQIVNSDVVKIHERTVQVRYMTSLSASILAEILMCAKPPGVKFRIAPHCQEDEDFRYIPDLQLQALEKELQVLRDTPFSLLTPAKK